MSGIQQCGKTQRLNKRLQCRIQIGTDQIRLAADFSGTHFSADHKLHWRLVLWFDVCLQLFYETPMLRQMLVPIT